MWRLGVFLVAAVMLVGGSARAAELTIELHMVDEGGIGLPVGGVKASDSAFGLILVPQLYNLSPGPHGFHLHQAPACGPKEKDGKVVPGLAAGGHLDPDDRRAHRGPYENGHLGDLPELWARDDGSTRIPMLVPRLEVADLRGHAFVIHQRGDSYSDEPSPGGGGGPRFACGVIR